MKKIYSSKKAVYLLLVGIMILMAFGILSIVMLSIQKSANNTAGVTAYLICFCIDVLCLLFLSFVLNRLGCKIWFDRDTYEIRRQGFFFGYEYRLRVSDIQDVVVVTVQNDAVYYILLDKVKSKYEGGSNESYIRFECTPENKNFIRQFWDKTIRE